MEQGCELESIEGLRNGSQLLDIGDTGNQFGLLRLILHANSYEWETRAATLTNSPKQNHLVRQTEDLNAVASPGFTNAGDGIGFLGRGWDRTSDLPRVKHTSHSGGLEPVTTSDDFDETLKRWCRV